MPRKREAFHPHEEDEGIVAAAAAAAGEIVSRRRMKLAHVTLSLCVGRMYAMTLFDVSGCYACGLLLFNSCCMSSLSLFLPHHKALN